MLRLFVAVMLTCVRVEGFPFGDKEDDDNGPGKPPAGSVMAGNEVLDQDQRDQKPEDRNDEQGANTEGVRVYVDWQEGQNARRMGTDNHNDREGPTLYVSHEEAKSAKDWFEKGGFQRQANRIMLNKRNGGRFDGKYVLIQKDLRFQSGAKNIKEAASLRWKGKRGMGDLVQGVIIYGGEKGGWETPRAKGKGGHTEWLGMPRRKKGALSEGWNKLKKKMFGKDLKWEDLCGGNAPGTCPTKKYIMGAYNGDSHEFETDTRFRYTLRLWRQYASFDMVLTPAPQWKKMSKFWPMIEMQMWQMDQRKKYQQFRSMGLDPDGGQPGMPNMPGGMNSGMLENQYENGPGAGSFGRSKRAGRFPYESQRPGSRKGSKPKRMSKRERLQAANTAPELSSSQSASTDPSSPAQATPPDTSSSVQATSPQESTDTLSSQSATETSPASTSPQGELANKPPAATENSVSANLGYTQANRFQGIQQQPLQQQPAQMQQQPMQMQQQPMQMQQQPMQMQQQPMQMQQQPMQMQQQAVGQGVQQQAPVQQAKNYEQDEYWMPESDPNSVNMPDTVREETELETEVASGTPMALLPRIVAQGEAWTTKHQEWLLHGAFLVVGLVFGYAGRGATNPRKNGAYAQLLDEV